MNWIVVTKEDDVSGDRIRITGNRYRHILVILKKTVSDEIRVLIPNQAKGIYRITEIKENYVEVSPLELARTLYPSGFQGFEIFFALPRPQTGKKILQLCGVYGVGKIHFLFPHHKNKEYLTSPLYQGGEIAELQEGMAQSGNPFLTEVGYLRNYQDFLKTLRPEDALVFDPTGNPYGNFLGNKHGKNMNSCQFVFGPESGFTVEELEVFRERNFKIANLGKVILRTEYAFHGFLHQTHLMLEADST